MNHICTLHLDFLLSNDATCTAIPLKRRGRARGEFDAMSTFQKTTDLENLPRSKHVNSHFMGHYSQEDQQNKAGMVLLLS